MSINVSDYPTLNQYALFSTSLNANSTDNYFITGGDYHYGSLTSATPTFHGIKNDNVDDVSNATSELSTLISNINALTTSTVLIGNYESHIVPFAPGNYSVTTAGLGPTSYTFFLQSNTASAVYVFIFPDQTTNFTLYIANADQVHTNNIIFLFQSETQLIAANMKGIVLSSASQLILTTSLDLTGKIFVQDELYDILDTNVNIDGTSSCFAEGTRIVTPKGTVLVEELKVGDEVWTRGKILDNKTFEEGTFVAKKIVWTGNYSAFTSDNEHAPVLIRKGALGPKLPSKDLYVSRNHSVIVSGELVPAYKLINGTTIQQSYDRKNVRYYHFELEDHMAVLAHGLLTESYLDTGNRYSFTSMQRGPLNKSVSHEFKEDTTVKTRVWPVPNGSANGMMKSIMIAPSSELTQI